MDKAIFISYRRSDASGHAGRLYDRLKAHFGAERIFMDIDTLEPGVDFVDRIDEALKSCGAVLAVIGQGWVAASDTEGRRRLDDPGDFVGVEIGAALYRGVTVIPVLVQRASMPAEKDLPDRLKPLTRRHAVELDDARWDYDVGRLVRSLEKAMTEQAEAEAKADVPLQKPDRTVAADTGAPAERSSRGRTVGRRPKWLAMAVAGAVAVVAVVAVTWIALRRGEGSDEGPEKSWTVAFEDRLDDSSTGWPQGGIPECDHLLTEEGYRLISAERLTPCGAATFFDDELSELSNSRVGVTTTWVEGAATNVNPAQGVGVAGPRCRTVRRDPPPNDGYLFAISPNGYYQLVRYEDARQKVLTDGRTGAVSPRLGTPRPAALECIEEGSSLILRLFDGTELVDEVRDDAPLPPGTGGMSVTNLSDSEVEVLFTDFSVSVPDGR
jgi:hypothetical protein